jgi:hypothetical protein
MTGSAIERLREDLIAAKRWDDLASTYREEASLLRKKGDEVRALKIYKKQEELSRELDLPERLCESLLAQAEILAGDRFMTYQYRSPMQKRHELYYLVRALPLIREAYELARKHGFSRLEMNCALYAHVIEGSLTRL